MKALISPNEVVFDGYRVVQVEEQAFAVASPLFWVDCGNHIKPDTYYYKGGSFRLTKLQGGS